MFKVGDRVIAVKNGHSGDTNAVAGQHGVVTAADSTRGDHKVSFDGMGYKNWNIKPGDLELEDKSTATKETSMSLIDKFNELTTAEPLKSFVKHGIKTSAGKLTTEGTELLLNILSAQPAIEAELVKVTDALTAADKKTK